MIKNSQGVKSFTVQSPSSLGPFPWRQPGVLYLTLIRRCITSVQHKFKDIKSTVLSHFLLLVFFLPFLMGRAALDWTHSSPNECPRKYLLYHSQIHTALVRSFLNIDLSMTSLPLKPVMASIALKLKARVLCPAASSCVVWSPKLPAFGTGDLALVPAAWSALFLLPLPSAWTITSPDLASFCYTVSQAGVLSLRWVTPICNVLMPFDSFLSSQLE